tara:strand:+ start:3743 stop:4192 length:450 start_codon:yes stop_codon:yes gene_type:complete
MFIKFFLLFVFLYNNYLFAESYIQNLEIINDSGVPIHYNVEVVKTYEDQKTGLMHRKNLEENKGMLFLFDSEKKASFWMKNTFISLDIIFINKDGSINTIYKNTKPLSLKTLNSKGNVLAVLEINSGDTDKNSIGKKSYVNISNLIKKF